MFCAHRSFSSSRIGREAREYGNFVMGDESREHNKPEWSSSFVFCDCAVEVVIFTYKGERCKEISWNCMGYSPCLTKSLRCCRERDSMLTNT